MRAKTLFASLLFPAVLGAVLCCRTDAIHSEEAAVLKFVDIASSVGFSSKFYCGGDVTKPYIIETLGNGVALFDYNNDGYLDAFFVSGTRLQSFSDSDKPTNRLYRNDGHGRFIDVTESAGLIQTGWGQGVCVGDYDNDGFDDMLVTYLGQNVLYRNNGDGTFSNVTVQAGLKNETNRWGTGCSFLDYDRDGKLDLFVANYVDFDMKATPKPGDGKYCQWRGVPVMCGPRGLKGTTNQLFHNEGQGIFKDVSVSSGITSVGERYSLSVTPLDFDEDGWVDIYVAVDSRPSILYRNNRDGTFKDVAMLAGVAVSEDGREQAGMGTAAGDFDGDGHQDLVKTNFIGDTANLYQNGGNGTFSDWVHTAGLAMNTRFLGWGVALLDYDNDGLLDLFMVNGHVYPEVEAIYPDEPYRQPRVLFRNVGKGRFTDVSASTGTDIVERHSGRGLAVGDFDNDGDLDIFVNNMNEPPSLLENRGGNSNHFLSIKTVGTQSNRNGLGTLITISVSGRTQIAEVRSGSSFMSNNDLRMHFGLNQAQQADWLELKWPSGRVERIKDIKTNQFITVVEGKGIVDSKGFPKAVAD